MPRVSLKNIATSLGVSEQTVSRALRGERYVRPELRQKIQAMAEKLGYRPDPRINALLAHMRKRDLSRRGETIAYVLPDASERNARNNPFSTAIIEGARLRSERFGFGFEIHSIGDHLNLSELERILYARGIEMLIIAPPLYGALRTLPLHWERYAAVMIGPSIWRPRLNRVLPNYYMNMLNVLRHLGKLGYRKPALVIKQSVLLRTVGAIEASFLQNAGMVGVKAPARFVYQKMPKNHLKEFRDWVAKRAIDVVISDQNQCNILREIGFKVPQDIGYVTVAGNTPFSVSGINVRTDLLGAHAVDLLAGHYYRNERGVPEIPKFLMHEGEWQIGKTTMPQPPRRSAEPLAYPASQFNP